MLALLWYLCLFLYAVQAWVIFGIFTPLLRPERKPKGRLPAVSVIICAKNEAVNLERNLPFILSQKYPDFEVIVIDDHSSDNSVALCEGMMKTQPKLRLLQASEQIKDKQGKKWALSEAIEKAKFRHLLFTDADCRPGSLLWIEEMASRFTGRRGIVLVIGEYNKSGKWFDGLVQYDTIMTAITYLSMAKRGMAYMGVGRNLAYQKRLFSRRIMTSDGLASGDDDLFVQRISGHGNTVICTEARSHTFSDPPESYRQWLRQKVRHNSTAWQYRRNLKIRLLLMKISFYTPNYLVFVMLILAFHPGLVIFVFTVRWLAWLAIFNRIRSKLGFDHAIFLLPCFEIYFSIHDVWTALRARLGNSGWM